MSEQAWRKYVSFWHPNIPTGFRQVKFQRFTVQTEAGELRCSSMLTEFELAYLHHLARERYTGTGAIVDLGPYRGLTTYALAAGARAGLAPRRARIASYDLFLSYPWFEKGLDDASPQDIEDGLEALRCGSVFPEYLRLVRDYIDMIDIFPGDALQMKWRGEPVEILFIDIAKSWEINAWVIRQFFPSLISGGSWVVHQDYVYFAEYWTQLTMEHFADRFERDAVIFGATAGFRCIAPITPEEAAVDLHALSLTRKMTLLERATAKMPPPARPVMQCAQAYCLLQHGDYVGAAALLRDVNTERLTDDPVLDFSAIATSNRKTLEEMLVTGDNRTISELSG